jgi:hypothetical protein
VSDDLTVFWTRVDMENPVFTGDELKRLPVTARAQLDSHLLLRPSESLRMIPCEACGDDHVEAVEIMTAPAGSKPRAYISCPEAGRVSVDMERLQQWSVDLDALARTVTLALNLLNPIVSIMPNRVWLLGTRKFDEHMRDVFLIRGVNWPDNRQILESATRLTASPCPLLLCQSRFPVDPEWQSRNRIVFSLSETAWIGAQPSILENRVLAGLREYKGPRELDHLQPTPVEDRPTLIKNVKNRFDYGIKDICSGAEVDRSLLNKWKLGHVSDDSVPSRRIESFLRGSRHPRRPGRSSL